MTTQILPALGNRVQQLFSFSGGSAPEKEYRLYQCVKKEHKYDCIEKVQGDGLLLFPEAKLIAVPSYFPKELDTIILQTKLYMD